MFFMYLCRGMEETLYCHIPPSSAAVDILVISQLFLVVVVSMGQPGAFLWLAWFGLALLLMVRVGQCS